MNYEEIEAHEQPEYIWISPESSGPVFIQSLVCTLINHKLIFELHVAYVRQGQPQYVVSVPYAEYKSDGYADYQLAKQLSRELRSTIDYRL